MTLQFLPVIRSNAALELFELAPRIASAQCDLRSILRFCQLLRMRGICSLLLSGLPAPLFADLHRSGREFLHFLRNAPDSAKVTSKANAFFDAVACHDLDGAQEISRYSRPAWNRAEEYEDDFLYVLFVMKHFFLETSHEECTALIVRYEELLNGEDDVKFDMCRAFHEDNEQSFHDALDEFLTAHEERFAYLESSGAMPMEELATDGQFCCEGVALLRLAERQGFTTQPEYPFIPSVARLAISAHSDPESWRNPGP